jgi:peptide/nickel transport system substrate-binding protein
MTKRILITALVLLASALLVFAGGKQEAATGTEEAAAETTAMAPEGNESPMLVEMVENGEIPSLEERLPTEPKVVETADAIGRYGGTLRRTYLGPSDGLAYGRLVYDPVLRFTVDGLNIEPNLAKDWDVSSDGTVYTIYFREGTKWSDGEPFTADDVMFWYEKAMLNTDISPAPPRWMVAGGEAGIISKVDDYTIRIRFSQPYAFFVRELAYRGVAKPDIALPAHYMEQYHPDFVDKDKLDSMAQDEGFEVWTDLWGERQSYWDNPEMPVLSAWYPTNEPGESRLIAVRNPYYWKVDTEGRQLPYMDRVVHDQIENKELVLLKASNGELDMQFRHLTLDNYSLLRENQEVGDYTVYTHSGDRASDVAFWPNMSHEDPVYHELMNNTEFKKALMYGIDRDELNELFYFGLGTPRAITAISSEPTYVEDHAQRYIEYDPQEANAILDRIGFDQRDSNGIRLGPDGEPIFFTLYYATSWPIHGEIAQIVADYWKELGIDSLIKPLERSVFYQMSYNNEIPLTVFTSPGTSLGNNWWIFPKGAHNSWAYGRWYATGGKEGIEPPPGSKIRQAMDLYDEAMQSPDMDEIIEAIKQILDWGTEEIWGIGLVGEIPAIGVISNNVGNVPQDAPSGTHLLHPGNLMPEQWYFKSPQ